MMKFLYLLTSTIYFITTPFTSAFTRYHHPSERIVRTVPSTPLPVSVEYSYDNNNKAQKNTNSALYQSIRFLGKGENAVVRPGVVLVAPTHEYNHFLRRSAVFIHAMGLNSYGEYVTRGVILDHPTAFTMGEMGGGSVTGTLAANILFQGGDSGNDTVMLLHAHGNSGIQCGEMIGTSGIYQGGLRDAMSLVDGDELSCEEFKFFFNYVEFSEKELEAMLAATDTDGDAWTSVEVPTTVVLNNHFDRGDAWSYLRNQMKQINMMEPPPPSLE